MIIDILVGTAIGLALLAVCMLISMIIVCLFGR